MGLTRISRVIKAPIESVFRTVSQIDQFAKAVDNIVNIEFLSDAKAGVGTRFKETRLMNGKEVSNVLEVTEFEKNKKIRLISDSNGTVWDSLFVVSNDGHVTKLELTMEGRAYKLLPKILNPLLKGIITKAIENDMDSVKIYCEQKLKN